MDERNATNPHGSMRTVGSGRTTTRGGPLLALFMCVPNMMCVVVALIVVVVECFVAHLSAPVRLLVAVAQVR